MIEHDADLSGANTLALPARARRLARPTDVTALGELLAGRDPAEPLYVLGEGSNVVLRGDLPGLTVIPAFDGIDYLDESADQVRVRVGAGVVWDRLVADTVARGWGGLENLSLIPGTAGAAPFQNIGAYGVELADCLESVDTVAVADGRAGRFRDRAGNAGRRLRRCGRRQGAPDRQRFARAGRAGDRRGARAGPGRSGRQSCRRGRCPGDRAGRRFGNRHRGLSRTNQPPSSCAAGGGRGLAPAAPFFVRARKNSPGPTGLPVRSSGRWLSILPRGIPIAALRRCPMRGGKAGIPIRC